MQSCFLKLRNVSEINSFLFPADPFEVVSAFHMVSLRLSRF